MKGSGDIMASSEEEGEVLAQSVTNYYFADDRGAPISFSVLHNQWCEGDSLDFMKNNIFLNGIADSGHQRIFKQVTAWNLDILDQAPEVSVLSKEKNWIKLLKPRKAFEGTIRTILVTIWCLHIVKKNPETLGKSLWDQLRKVFSSYEVAPSENDLLNHIPLIRAAIRHDDTISNSKFLVTFMESPFKKEFDQDDYTGLDAKKFKFLVDDNEMYENMGDADDSDEDTDLFDSVCCICDNGGNLLCCEGRCMRSFHPTVGDGVESGCRSLGLSEAQVKAMPNFLCLNCQRKKHQCFACGKLGSSDKSSGAEVFSCVSATCGYFYHPPCVANLLHPTNEAEAEDLQKKIAAGESFTCPAHKCHICKERENKDFAALQFAVCRRCPRAYHRKCMPRNVKIGFDNSLEEDSVTRAWDGLLPNNRVLIYCLKHKIDIDLGTPMRNHIVFPREVHIPSMDLQSSKGMAVAKKIFVVAKNSVKVKLVSSASNYSEKFPSHVNSSIKKWENPSSGKRLLPSENSKISDASTKSLKDNIKSISGKVDKSSPINENWVSLAEERIDSMLKKGSLPSVSNQRELTIGKITKSTKSDSPMKKLSTSAPQVDVETKNRIMTLMAKHASSVTLEDVVKQHKVPSTHSHSLKIVVDKTITHGKVEGFVEAVQTALQKLEVGSSAEDAKAVCGPREIKQILKWKNKLQVYLAPFLHGMRYTSFGRHFTKVDKLKEIVDRLHWYVHDGDTVVDFCCGSNDFSCLMKEKLGKTGKNCSFKNFDVIQPKNDFSFEQRDWMSVQPDELPPGSNLIMGLNPPFGVKASLANKFIDKALVFKPKLIILIVPQETERLDHKKAAYDLVWEDEEKLAGKSFYLPGSVDANENQLDQWNNKPPRLSLWSRPDWTAMHKAIALEQGHVSNRIHDPFDRSNVAISEDNHETGIHPINGGDDSNKESHDKHGHKRKISLTYLQGRHEKTNQPNLTEASDDGGNEHHWSHLSGISKGMPPNTSFGLDYRAGYGGIGQLTSEMTRYTLNEGNSLVSYGQEYGMRGLGSYCQFPCGLQGPRAGLLSSTSNYGLPGPPRLPGPPGSGSQPSTDYELPGPPGVGHYGLPGPPGTTYGLPGGRGVGSLPGTDYGLPGPPGVGSLPCTNFGLPGLPGVGSLSCIEYEVPGPPGVDSVPCTNYGLAGPRAFRPSYGLGPQYAPGSAFPSNLPRPFSFSRQNPFGPQ